MEQEITKVGIGVMIFKDGKVLLGKRKSLHGQGEYAAPGGHLEYMESFEDCARREVREECGVEIKNLKFLHVANIMVYAPKHYINVSFTAEWASGESEVLEPEKLEGWAWYTIDNLPSPLFRQTELCIESYTMGSHYYNQIK